MDTKKFYKDLLRLERPWKVERVEYSVEEQEVHVYLTDSGHKGYPCPECGRQCPVHDHQPERIWRHLATMQMSTLLHAPVPRIKCDECGVKVVNFPWSGKHSRFTLMFESWAVEVLKTCSKSDASDLLRTSWDEADGLMARAVRRGLARREEKVNEGIAIDETSSKRGHNYLTIVTSHDDGAVQFVAEGRKEDSLDEYYETLSEPQKKGIKAISMDMWLPYINSTKNHISDADNKIVFDKFHVMRLANESVDKVRRWEHGLLLADGDDTLKRTKYLWLYNPDNMSDDNRHTFRELRKLDLKVSRAWAIKESLRRLWKYKYIGAARNYFRRWYFWATHSRLQPVIKVAKTIKQHLENILLFCKYPVTNALGEAVNAKIQHVKRMARGFRNIQSFKYAIYFHCGKLDLEPL